MSMNAGIDIIEVSRIRDAVEKWGDNFIRKIFTPSEIRYSENRRNSFQHYAARFAAKEACIKALCVSNRYLIQWTDIEVLNDGDGKPTVKFHNEAGRLKKKAGISEVIISMSHSKEYAVASAIVIRK